MKVEEQIKKYIRSLPEPKRKQLYQLLIILIFMWQIEALYRLMVANGLITKKEFEEEFKKLKKEYDKDNK